MFSKIGGASCRVVASMGPIGNEGEERRCATSMTRVTTMEVFLKRSATPPCTGTIRSQRTLTISSATPYATLSFTCQSNARHIQPPALLTYSYIDSEQQMTTLSTV